MRRSVPTLARLGVVALTTSVVVSLAIVGAASAATSGTVTVTGGSASKIVLTLGATGVDFGDNLTPDGDASTSTDTIGVNVDGTVPSAGACYEWGSSVAVKSNVSYDVTVSAAAANSRLDFLTADPADYSDCTTGTQVSTTTTEWVSNATRTSTRSHAYWLGLDVLWSDAPNANLADATLTLTAAAAS